MTAFWNAEWFILDLGWVGGWVGVALVLSLMAESVPVVDLGRMWVEAASDRSASAASLCRRKMIRLDRFVMSLLVCTRTRGA